MDAQLKVNLREVIINTFNYCQTEFPGVLESSDTNRFRAILNDLLPGDSNAIARNLLAYSHEANAFCRLKNLSSSSSELEISKLVRDLREKFAVQENTARFIVGCIASLNGYGMPMSNPSNEARAPAPIDLDSNSLIQNLLEQAEFRDLGEIRRLTNMAIYFSKTLKSVGRKEDVDKAEQSIKGLVETLTHIEGIYREAPIESRLDGVAKTYLKKYEDDVREYICSTDKLIGTLSYQGR